MAQVTLTIDVPMADQTADNDIKVASTAKVMRLMMQLKATMEEHAPDGTIFQASDPGQSDHPILGPFELVNGKFERV